MREYGALMGRVLCCLICKTDISTSYWTRLDGCSCSSLIWTTWQCFFCADKLMASFAEVDMNDVCVHPWLDSPHMLLVVCCVLGCQ